MQKIADIRKDYSQNELDQQEVSADPVEQFARWWEQATRSQIEEVNAMTLCTADAKGRPQGRIVLLKDFDSRGFVFYTNYTSAKASQLATNPQACLVFFWKELERQVRISGLIEKVSIAESDAYYNSRPIGSRLGAWASPQSQPIASRQALEEKLEKITIQYEGQQVPRPAHWGGYRLQPDMVEFWQGRPSRLHDRIVYTLEQGVWKIGRLAP